MRQENGIIRYMCWKQVKLVDKKWIGGDGATNKGGILALLVRLDSLLHLGSSRKVKEKYMYQWYILMVQLEELLIN